jgi:hypothetical protein
MDAAPTSSYEKGDAVSSRSSMPARRTNSTWIKSSGLPQSASLDDHLAELCRFMEAHLHKLEKLRSNCDIDIFCGFFSDTGQATFVLSNKTLKRIGALSVDVILDVYPGE